MTWGSEADHHESRLGTCLWFPGWISDGLPGTSQRCPGLHPTCPTHEKPVQFHHFVQEALASLLCERGLVGIFTPG